MVRWGGWLVVAGLAGCSDSLLGYRAIEARIGGVAVPVGSEWEVRWATDGGLTVSCARVDAGVDTERVPVDGTVVLPRPVLPEPQWVDAGTFRYALALPVLVEPATPAPPVGDGVDSLEHHVGVWGIAAPMAWLEIDGDRVAAGAALMDGGLEAPAASWVEVDTREVDQRETLSGSLRPVPGDGELRATSLSWATDDAYFLWSGASLGGIRSTCEDARPPGASP